MDCKVMIQMNQHWITLKFSLQLKRVSKGMFTHSETEGCEPVLNVDKYVIKCLPELTECDILLRLAKPTATIYM